MPIFTATSPEPSSSPLPSVIHSPYSCQSDLLKTLIQAILYSFFPVYSERCPDTFTALKVLYDLAPDYLFKLHPHFLGLYSLNTNRDGLLSILSTCRLFLTSHTVPSYWPYSSLGPLRSLVLLNTSPLLSFPSRRQYHE